MTTDRDFDRITSAWLDLMPSEAPDRVIESVLQAAETTPQVRRPILRGPGRSSHMSRVALIAAVAALGVVLLGGALLMGGGRRAEPAPTPVPTVGQVTSPSASEEAFTSVPLVSPADASIRASWVADAGSIDALGNGGGPVDLVIDQPGSTLFVNNFGAGLAFSSTVSAAAVDELKLTLRGTDGGCSAGAVGTYRWSLSEERSALVLTPVDEVCAERALALGRTWGRSLTASSNVGAGYVTTMEPTFKVVLPDGAFQARTLDDFIEIADPNGAALMVIKNPQAFVDACSTAEERVPYVPGAAAFVEAFRGNDAFEVGEATALTIDGHDALHVVIGGKADYARCPGRDLYEYTPKSCECHFVVGQGASDSMYLVDVGSDTFMFIISPQGSTESEKPIVDSIRIPASIPTQ